MIPNSENREGCALDLLLKQCQGMLIFTHDCHTFVLFLFPIWAISCERMDRHALFIAIIDGGVYVVYGATILQCVITVQCPPIKSHMFSLGFAGQMAQ